MVIIGIVVTSRCRSVSSGSAGSLLFRSIGTTYKRIASGLPHSADTITEIWDPMVGTIRGVVIFGYRGVSLDNAVVLSPVTRCGGVQVIAFSLYSVKTWAVVVILTFMTAHIRLKHCLYSVQLSLSLANSSKGVFLARARLSGSYG